MFSTVRDTVLEVFAGPADTGVFSPSVQNSQFLTQKLILEKFPQIESVSMEMPNVHYFGYDFSKFKRIPGLVDMVSLILLATSYWSIGITRASHWSGMICIDIQTGEVYNPVDKPSGQINSTLARRDIRSKM